MGGQSGQGLERIENRERERLSEASGCCGNGPKWLINDKKNKTKDVIKEYVIMIRAL